MTSSTTIVQIAAKAAIVGPTGRVLILRESTADKTNTKVGYWGLVGGRLEPGETFADGLKREVVEETGLSVRIEGPLYVGEWHPIIDGVPHQIIAIFMLCHTASERVKLSLEHDQYEWVKPAERKAFAMMEPDCFVVDKLVGI